MEEVVECASNVYIAQNFTQNLIFEFVSDENVTEKSNLFLQSACTGAKKYAPVHAHVTRD